MYYPKTFEEALALLDQRANEIMVERQKKYGPENIRQAGQPGLRTRIGDKLARIDEAQKKFREREVIAEAIAVVSRYGAGATSVLCQSLLDFLEDLGPPAKQDFPDESFEDALFDLRNYATIWLMVRRGWWAPPLATTPASGSFTIKSVPFPKREPTDSYVSPQGHDSAPIEPYKDPGLPVPGCERCGGVGTIAIPAPGVRAGSFYTTQCPQCHGTGKSL